MLRGRLWVIQDHLGVLGRRWEAHPARGKSRGCESFRELRQRAVLRREGRAGIHGEVPTGSFEAFKVLFVFDGVSCRTATVMEGSIALITRTFTSWEDMAAGRRFLIILRISSRHVCVKSVGFDVWK